MVTAALIGCGGSSGGPSTSGSSASAPPVVTTKPYTNLETPEEASRFLIQAGFGGTESEIDALVGTDAAEWLAAEMAKPESYLLPQMQARYPTREDTDAHFKRMIWQSMLTADDVLRQRMMFALSQILVINIDGFFDRGYTTAWKMPSVITETCLKMSPTHLRWLII